MAKRQFMISILSMFILALLFGGLLFADIYSDSFLGINLTVPELWQKMPKAELERFQVELSNGPFGRIVDVHRYEGWRVKIPEKAPSGALKEQLGRVRILATEAKLPALDKITNKDSVAEHAGELHAFLEESKWVCDAVLEADVNYIGGPYPILEAEFTLRNPELIMPGQEQPAEFKAFWAALKTEKGWYQLHYLNLADEYDSVSGGIKSLFRSAQPIKQINVMLYVGLIFAGLVGLFLLFLVRNILREKNRMRTLKLTDTLPTDKGNPV